jgi:hypothetical protein
MNPLKVAITWLLKKHVKEEKTAMSKILFALSAMAGVIANGVSANALSIQVTDDAGVALSDQAVALTGDVSVAFSATSLTTDANGSATADLTSSTPGTYQITATLADGTAQSFSIVFLPVSVIAPEGPATSDNTEAVLAKLKELVAAAGAQAHAVFDDLIALAKKLA